MSIYSLKLTKLCMTKDFAGVNALDRVLNPINFVCCGDKNTYLLLPSGTQTQMTNLRYFSKNSLSLGGGIFCQTFRQS